MVNDGSSARPGKTLFQGILRTWIFDLDFDKVHPLSFDKMQPGPSPGISDVSTASSKLDKVALPNNPANTENWKINININGCRKVGRASCRTLRSHAARAGDRAWASRMRTPLLCWGWRCWIWCYWTLCCLGCSLIFPGLCAQISSLNSPFQVLVLPPRCIIKLLLQERVLGHPTLDSHTACF